MRYGIIAEIRLFLIILIAAFAVVYIVFNATSMIAQVNYTLDDERDREAYLLPVVEISNSIHIPKINITAPIVIENNDDEKALLEALKKGVLLFPGSVSPGQNGNTVLLGHSSDFVWSEGEYKSVFALLNKLEEGDLIKVYFNNEKFVYRVSGLNILSVEKINDAVSQKSDNNTLFLSSCWPIGTDWNRIMVTAKLID